MDIIDYELKRYEAMQLELEAKKVSTTASFHHSKSANNLDAIINMEKPPEVNNTAIIFQKNEKTDFIPLFQKQKQK